MNQLLLKNKLKTELPDIDWTVPKKVENYVAFAKGRVYKNGEYQATIKVVYRKGENTFSVSTSDGKGIASVRILHECPNIAKTVVNSLTGGSYDPYLEKFTKIWRSLL